MLRLYLDICALKRPWDDQSDPRVATETAAVRAILGEWRRGRVACVRSAAHDVENSFNVDHGRAEVVAEALEAFGPNLVAPASVARRAAELTGYALGTYDALHLAWAEHLDADALVTTDDRFLRRGSAGGVRSRVRIMNPVDVVREISR